MKNLIFTLSFTFLTIISYSQIPQFMLSKDNLNFPGQSIVVPIDDLSIEDSYLRIIDWININQNIPDNSQTIVSQLQNKYIRIKSNTETISLPNWLERYSKNPNTIRYTIEFRFEEKILIIDVIEIAVYIVLKPGRKDIPEVGSWHPMTLENKKMYKKNGKIKKGYSNKAQRILSYFNEIVISIESYINK